MTVQSQLPRKKPGPPATGKGTPVMVRLQPDQLKELDEWIVSQGKGHTRPEAIRDILKRWFFHPDVLS